jgi:O-acetyl-ADP-ribose deacetylase (regulator of RNase III)
VPFKIIRNDITKVKADAIVNTANPKPIYADGTDAAVYEAAGKEELLAARKEIGEILAGEVAVTPAFGLPADYIIHTVGPVWIDGKSGEFNTLASCYEKSLHKAVELKCRSIAFPLISTGVYGFPKDKALQIAISVISRFLLANEMDVILVVFDRRAFELSGKLFQDVDAFINENDVSLKQKKEYSAYESGSREEKYLREEQIRRAEEVSCLQPELDFMPIQAPIAEDPDRSLDDVIEEIGETFQQRLLHLIDERGLSDVEVYKRANMDRKLFSKIRCKEDYKPKKKTVLALAIALELDLKDTRDLLGRAELALSPSSKFDLIVEYFISRGVYDIYTINMALFQHQQPILGE